MQRCQEVAQMHCKVPKQCLRSERHHGVLTPNNIAMYSAYQQAMSSHVIMMLLKTMQKFTHHNACQHLV